MVRKKPESKEPYLIKLLSCDGVGKSYITAMGTYVTRHIIIVNATKKVIV